MRGLSLLEMLIGIAIILLLAAVGWASFSRFKNGADLNTAAEMVISGLNDARSKTLASQEASQYGVHFESDRIISFKGAGYTSGNSNNKETFFPSNVEMYAISLNGGGSDVTFKRLTGTTDQNGTVALRVKSNTSFTRTITILQTGVAGIQ